MSLQIGEKGSFGCGENVVMMENCGNENKRDDGSGSKLLGGDG
jgi:hypothetical protein